MKSSSRTWSYGILMTLLLAALVGVSWLTLSGELPSSSVATAPPVRQVEQALANTPLPIPTNTLSILPIPTDTPIPSATPTEPPTATPLPPTATSTVTPKPTVTPTPQPTSTFTPTPIALPLPTPEASIQQEPGWLPYKTEELAYLVAADRRGFVWIGNETGVRQQSSGTEAITWQFANEQVGVGARGVQSIYGDSQGGVWIGGEGASFFNGLLWRTFTISEGLAAGVVQVITEDAQGRIWLGTNAGLSIWGGNSFFTLNQTVGLPNDDVLSLLADDNLMWIGTNGGGLYRFEENKMQILSAESVGLLSNVVTALGKLPSLGLLIGSERGLMIFDGERASEVTDVPSDRITAIVTSKEGEAWVATEGSGLHRYAKGRWSRLLDTANLPDAAIVSMAIDRYGTLWIVRPNGKIVRYLTDNVN